MNALHSGANQTYSTLVPEPYPKENVEFIEKNGIRQFQVHIRANKGEVSITQDTMRDALKIILDRANHPILIHCNKGKVRLPPLYSLGLES